jgi:hypothetical protein
MGTRPKETAELAFPRADEEFVLMQVLVLCALGYFAKHLDGAIG